MFDDEAGECWDNVSDIVRLPAYKIGEILGAFRYLKSEMSSLGNPTDLDEDTEIYLGMASIEPLEYEVERVIVASLDGQQWHVIAMSSRDTTSEEDRTYANLQLLMMADGVPG